MESDFYFYENEKRLHAIFLLLSLERVYVFFEGRNYDKEFFSCDLYTKKGLLMESSTLVTVWDQDPSSGEFSEDSMPLEKAIEKHVLWTLERSDSLWSADSGGYGTWEWTKDGLVFSTYLYHVENEIYEERELGFDPYSEE